MFWNDGTNTMAPLVLFGALAAVEWGFFFISYFVIRRVNFELESLALFLTGIGVMMLIRQSGQLGLCSACCRRNRYDFLLHNYQAD